MDILDTLNIAGSGLSAQRLRLQTIASNMANARTTRTEDGTPYQRRVPIFETMAVDPFGSDVERNIAQVEVSSVETIEDYVEVYDPAHPDADADGFVSFPDINILEEMVDMMTTSRTYEANTVAVETTYQLANAALELGR